ncbi:MAG: hypothetical protein HeimC2_31980 [Candidatus Heimdallarchaeota archaeon LC_2]|nr:MAG: hypothetical protein HeimC2_31980 [Candidatus Heimdallarchaeota archaeon LC_2]
MELVKHRKKDSFFLHLVISKFISEEETKLQEYVGINRGVKYLAVTSNNQFYNGTRLREIRNKYFRLRRSLQKKGTRSAKRKLKRLSGKEQRFRKDTNHCLSKQIVKNIKANSVIVLEDLTGIRQKAMYPKKSKTSREINSWPYYDLEQKIIYKASEKHIEVAKWNPEFISQRCSACSFIKKDNYRSRQFSCVECQFSINADLNAARNQIHNYFSELPMVQLVFEALRFLDGAPVIIPYVAS